MIRYERAPSDELKSLFKNGGFLCSLVAGLKPRADFENIPFDVQFRERDAVSIYCGLTKVVDINLVKTGTLIRVDSADVYKAQDVAQKLMGDWDILRDKRKDFEEALMSYLAGVWVAKNQREGEGAIQARYAERHGKNWKPELTWVICDREARIGYTSEEEKQKMFDAFSSLRERVLRVVRKMTTIRGWAAIEEAHSSELDFIGVSRNGEKLVLIEAKRPNANAGIYYSPLQLFHYVLEWEHALRSSDGAGIVAGINRLIDAKKEIGLLPRNAPRLKANPAVQPVFVTEKKDWTGEVESRRLEIVDLINQETNGMLEGLEMDFCAENK